MLTHHGESPKDSRVKDPVCGMAVDPARAAATSSYAGLVYHFCSVICKGVFDREPQRFAQAQSNQEHAA